MYRDMCGYRCYFEFTNGGDYFDWIEDAKRGALEVICSMIVNSQDNDLDNVISKPVVT